MSQESQQAATTHVTDQPACDHALHEVMQPGMAHDAKVCAVVVQCYLAKEGVLAKGDESLLLCGGPQNSAIIRTSCGFYASFVQLTLCPGLQVTRHRLEWHRQTAGCGSANACSTCKSQLDMKIRMQTYKMLVNKASIVIVGLAFHWPHGAISQLTAAFQGTSSMNLPCQWMPINPTSSSTPGMFKIPRRAPAAQPKEVCDSVQSVTCQQQRTAGS
jgi:hypothetical protein